MAELSEVQKLYKDLRKFVRRDNYTKAVNVCTQLRKKLPDDLDPLRCHCVCLLKGDKFQQSFDVLHAIEPENVDVRRNLHACT